MYIKYLILKENPFFIFLAPSCLTLWQIKLISKLAMKFNQHTVFYLRSNSLPQCSVGAFQKAPPGRKAKRKKKITHLILLGFFFFWIQYHVAICSMPGTPTSHIVSSLLVTHGRRQVWHIYSIPARSRSYQVVFIMMVSLHITAWPSSGILGESLRPPDPQTLTRFELVHMLWAFSIFTSISFWLPGYFIFSSFLT